MNNTVSLNLLAYTDLFYSQIKRNHVHAFPNNSFDSRRAHPVLCSIGVLTNSSNCILFKDLISYKNPLHELFSQQVIANIKIISNDKEWAYPNGILNIEHSLISLRCISSSIKNYETAIKILGQFCLTENTVDFDLTNFMKKITFSSYYDYAYPNNVYSEANAHPSFQMLISLTENVTSIIKSVQTDDSQLKTILIEIENKLQISIDQLHQAYPNNNFQATIGHKCLTKFVDSWKSFKDFSVSSLNNYFKEQALIEQYANKIKSLDKTNIIDSLAIGENTNSELIVSI